MLYTLYSAFLAPQRTGVDPELTTAAELRMDLELGIVLS